MRKSLDHAAHFSHMDELDATNLVAARGRLRKSGAEETELLAFRGRVVLLASLKLYTSLECLV
ncbi:MAG: hypothetical protein R3A45_02690 [Bdellovibrionota bacterium]